MIPKSWEGSDLYKDLGISRDATPQQVRNAHRNLIKQLHPDVNKQPDRGLRFQAANDAYVVLGSPEKRELYDAYTGGHEQIFDHAPLHSPPLTQHRGRIGSIGSANLGFKLLSRIAMFSVMVLVVRNVQYPGSSPNSADAQQASGDNQVLAMMVGPQGPPGISGVDGATGADGINGIIGRDGVAGATGVDGINGTIGRDGVAGANGVSGTNGTNGTNGAQGSKGSTGSDGVAGGDGDTLEIISLPTGDETCAFGGTKFVSTTGVITYSCNGGSTLGQGVVNIGACDSEVVISLSTQYLNRDFMMSAITVSQLSGACNGTTIDAMINVKSSGTKFGSASNYRLSDVVHCTKVLVLSPTSRTNSVSLGVSDCTNQTYPGHGFVLTDMSARDLSDEDDSVAIQITS
jgi:hypothetical protein